MRTGRSFYDYALCASRDGSIEIPFGVAYDISLNEVADLRFCVALQMCRKKPFALRQWPIKQARTVQMEQIEREERDRHLFLIALDLQLALALHDDLERQQALGLRIDCDHLAFDDR
jgi:hypothetical protein